MLTNKNTYSNKIELPDKLLMFYVLIFCCAGAKRVFSPERPELKVIESSSETEGDGGPLSHSSSSSLGGTKSKWETVVIVAVNLSRLDMSTNMGSVMGQTLYEHAL